eukprot:s603_g21.t1
MALFYLHHPFRASITVSIAIRMALKPRIAGAAATLLPGSPSAAELLIYIARRWCVEKMGLQHMSGPKADGSRIKLPTEVLTGEPNFVKHVKHG